MNNKLFSEISGKSIIVKDFTIEQREETLIIKMSSLFEEHNAYCIVFENVSSLKLSEISYPFQICGFEILDYTARNYQKNIRYFVNDYEDGKLSFYCENFEIFNEKM